MVVKYILAILIVSSVYQYSNWNDIVVKIAITFEFSKLS